MRKPKDTKMFRNQNIFLTFDEAYIFPILNIIWELSLHGEKEEEFRVSGVREISSRAEPVLPEPRSGAEQARSLCCSPGWRRPCSQRCTSSGKLSEGSQGSAERGTRRVTRARGLPGFFQRQEMCRLSACWWHHKPGARCGPARLSLPTHASHRPQPTPRPHSKAPAICALAWPGPQS